MNDYATRVCIFCQPKTHYEPQPDGTVRQVAIPGRCEMCIAWHSDTRYCECACYWLREDGRP